MAKVLVCNYKNANSDKSPHIGMLQNAIYPDICTLIWGFYYKVYGNLNHV